MRWPKDWRGKLKKWKPFFQYCIVGGLGTLVDILSLYIFVHNLHFPLLLATSLSFILAATHNFILNKIWTFQDRSKNYRELYLKFLFVSLIGLGLTNLLMYILVKGMGLWYIYAKLFTSAGILWWNFFANRHWTFRKQKKITPPRRIIFPLDLSIIIPAFNEEKRIKKTLAEIEKYILKNNLSSELIVIDDGSKDHTREILANQKTTFSNLSVIQLRKNYGKGYAVKKGIEKSKGKLVLMTDADNSTPIQEVEKLLKAIKEGADIAIGSRYLKGSIIEIKQPFFRVFLGRVGNGLIRLLLLPKIKDTQCGFKLFKQQVAQEIFSQQRIKRWGFDMEVLAIAQRRKYKIKEIPIHWHYSPQSRLRPIRDSFRTLGELFYIKYNLLSGVYRDEKEE